MREGLTRYLIRWSSSAVMSYHGVMMPSVLPDLPMNARTLTFSPPRRGVGAKTDHDCSKYGLMYDSRRCWPMASRNGLVGMTHTMTKTECKASSTPMVSTTARRGADGMVVACGEGAGLSTFMSP